MSLTQTTLLGLIAGATILLGMPVGRLRSPAPALRMLLNSTAVGVLIFLIWDVLSAAWEPIDAALGDLHSGRGGAAATVAGYGALFATGLVIGLLSLVAYERWISKKSHHPTEPTTDPTTDPTAGSVPASAPGRLALLIAIGIGLHNFAEGLAIGGAAAGGEISLATLLVIGFALHNATEGFGIVAPLAAAPVDSRPSWGFLLALGGIGGGPTVLGTILGHSVASEQLKVVFLTLAAGSILYVVTQLLFVAARSPRRDLVHFGLLIGLLTGFVTDAVVTAGGV